MADIDILVGQKVTLSIVPTIASSSGLVSADLVGTPTWVAADPDIVGVVPANDGLSAVVIGKAAGSSVVTANAVGASGLSANHTVVVTANNLATAITLTAERVDG